MRYKEVWDDGKVNIEKLLQDALWIAFAAIVILISFAIGLQIWGGWHDEWSGWNAQFSVSDGVCNIAVIPIEGDIVGYATADYTDDEGNITEYGGTVADDIVQKIRIAENDPNINGILLRINSGGGWIVASSIIADAVAASPLYTVALIRDIGASGAYLAATAADAIVASPMSDVGSIGITMSYLDYSKKNAEEGIQFIPLASGPYKDAGYPDKSLTPGERALFERDIKMAHDEFVRMVAENRDVPVEKVAALADGSTLPGTLAFEAGLIDALGNQETARTWFAGYLGTPEEQVLFCEW